MAWKMGVTLASCSSAKVEAADRLLDDLNGTSLISSVCIAIFYSTRTYVLRQLCRVLQMLIVSMSTPP